MNAVAPPKLQVVILAAGFSSRLGRPKALARVRGCSLLHRTLLLVTRVAPAKIIVVVPRRAARFRIEARGFKARGPKATRVQVAFAANPRRADGLSSSVRRGIALGRYSPALLLLPVDLAALQQRDLARLISRWRAARRCVIARRIEQHGETAPGGAQRHDVPPRGHHSHAGPPQGGVPLILPRWLYAQALGVTGDVGLRDLINGLPIGQRVLVRLPSATLDVDTPQDLRAARAASFRP
jgi:molybdenum cofactor cytidylyltransferase